ncbi:upstream activation factor subunit spp27 homolog Non2 [Rhynchophorus ferrugineus]|uniref:upstream activation factor subunit spp27 homolog Non2 n=1 Tax=Rhynchophorus ferrugineus TaxID=354439 RepID=UPI003FCD98D4
MADISKEDLRKEIAAILKDADLASTSAKKVRQELEEKLDVKLQSRKKEIDDLVMEFVSSKKDNDKKKGKKNDSDDEGGEDDEEEEDEEEEEAESDEDKKKKRGSTGKKPAAKKAKKDSEDESGSEQSEGESEEDSEEYSPKKSSKPAKTRKLPPKKKKGSESDSDEDWGKKKGGKKGGGGKKGSGYTKPLQLSPELAALVGADSMARHEVVKKLWAIIKERNLYDPKNKQYTICDDALFKVIGTKRFRTFAMMKYLKSHFIS